MPIYAYRCQDCGFEKDELQKFSDAPLTVCPACGGNGFAKQLTAPAFQLKGSGWYVTDFRDGVSKKKTDAETKPDSEAKAAATESPASAASDSGTGTTAAAAVTPDKPASSASGSTAASGSSSASTPPASGA